METEKKQQAENIQELRTQVQTYMDALRSSQSQLRIEQNRLAEVNDKLRLAEEARVRSEEKAELSVSLSNSSKKINR